MKLSLKFFLLLFFVFFNSYAQDIEPPKLWGVTVTSGIVKDNDTVSVLIYITDDISGIDTTSIYAEILNTTNSRQYVFINFGSLSGAPGWKRIAKNIWEGKAVIPKYAGSGIWKVNNINLTDLSHNYKQYNEGTDYDGSFTVNSSTPDITPPQLSLVTITSSSFPIIANGDSIEVTILAVDSLSGIDSTTIQIILINPTGNQQIIIYGIYSPYRNPNGWVKTGSHQWTGKAKISQYAISGLWKVQYISAKDRAANQAYNYNGGFFNVVSSSPDSIPPQINSVGVTPIVNVGDSISVILKLTDEVSGVDTNRIFAMVQSSISTQFLIISGNRDWDSNGWRKIATDTWQGTVQIPQFAAFGKWYISNIIVNDFAGNEARIQGDSSVTFEVVQFHKLSVNPGSLGFIASGQSKSFTVTSDTNWTVSTSDSWIKVSTTSGSNNGNITITVDSNATQSQRTGTVKVTGNFISQVVIITQASFKDLIVSTHQLQFSVNNETKPLSIVCDSNWVITNNLPWLSVSTLSGKDSTTVSLTVSANDSLNSPSRFGVLTITAPSKGLSQFISVSQDGIVPTIPPANLSTIVSSFTPTLHWEVVPSSEGYCIQVATDSTFNSGIVVDVCGITSNDYTIPSGKLTNGRVDGEQIILSDGTIYYWRVSATIGGKQSAWSMPAFMKVQVATSINSNILSQEIKIYPNPNTGIFYVFAPHKDTETLSFINTIGMEVLVVSPKKDLTEITGIPKGFYLVKIKSSGSTIVKKVMVE